MTSQDKGEPPREELEQFLAQPSRHLLLDYDGTLVPFAPRPELAVADAELCSLLVALSAQPQNQVHVVTGRTRRSIEALLEGLPVRIHAEHGFWSREKDLTWQTNAAGALAALHDLRTEFELAERSLPGALLEVKDSALTLHYRLSPPEQLSETLGRLRRAIEGRMSPDVEILEGIMVFEVRSRGAHKGLIVERLLASQVPAEALFCIGDDRTDEDLFHAAPLSALTVKVGLGPTAARFRVRDTSTARRLLDSLI
jgi:trehalose 6-phosphate synthase/phosphatase